MVREGIDRRRRATLRAVAAGIGVLPVGRGARSLRTDEEPEWRASMRGTVKPTGADFLVTRDDGTSYVFRRGADDPAFGGSGSDAIQYAIDAGEATGTGTAIEVAPGTYELDRPVTLAGATWIAGSGPATTLRAVDGLNADLLTIPSGAEHVRVSDLGIDGNRSGNERGDCLVVVGYTWRPVVEHLVVRNGAGDGVRFEGGPNGEYSYEPTLTDVDVARCAGDGFVFGYTGDLFGVNLYAESCESYGFTMADAGGTLIHPHAYDTRGEAGIRMIESAKDATLVGAHSERNRRHGVLIKGDRVTLRNAFVANNSRDDPGSYSGVVLDGAHRSRVVESALLNDDDYDRTQGHGLVETSDSRDNLISFNLLHGNAAAAVDRPSRSTGSTYRFNRGYRTENGGRTTVGDGDSITHGLADRPRQYWINSTEPGTYAHVVDATRTYLVVEAVRIRTGEPSQGDVDVVWGASTT
jgi:hypothetical protein